MDPLARELRGEYPFVVFNFSFGDHVTGFAENGLIRSSYHYQEKCKSPYIQIHSFLEKGSQLGIIQV
ncbi:hypothetical protein M513_07929 [Trichuris suis]|uniref:Uncharacterized protein n=1 Tax=Trichuris suis TaxID=68888 RepID=A0A085M1R9_9BILA|nr:hypothetical protein M513_07929 [Trichuris suis]